VKKYLKSLLIGELAPDQPSFESNKKVSVLETNCEMTWGPAWEKKKYKRGRYNFWSSIIDIVP